MAATNANLREKVGEGTFRQDLFYRLNTIELRLPPLRERGEDIILLAEYFLKFYSGKYSVGDVVLGASAKQKLLKHTWPGNVRELQHCIERAIVLGDKMELAAEDIRLEDSVVALGSSSSSSSSDSSSSSSEGSIMVDSLNLQTLEREAIKRAISLSNGNLTQAAELQHCIERAIVLGDKTELAAEDIRLEDSVVASRTSSGSIKVDSLNLQTLEREAIKRAISLSNGNLTQAAELLGITRFALYSKTGRAR